jgi:hypothetical protein
VREPSVRGPMACHSDYLRHRLNDYVRHRLNKDASIQMVGRHI